MALATAAGAIFVIAVALLYGSTMAPSPRAGLQPVENPDHAFYAVLGRDLAETGTETTLSASGFTEIPGLPTQSWYHWGELWLASIPIAVIGTEPMAARYLVVLPVVLLALVAMTGTIVQRLARTRSRRAHLLGVLTCLFVAPVPLVQGPFFSSWSFGMILGITLYGLGAVAALVAIYAVAGLGERQPTWTHAAFIGSVVALMLPAHIVLALLGLAGAGIMWSVRIADSFMAAHRPPMISPSLVAHPGCMRRAHPVDGRVGPVDRAWTRWERRPSGAGSSLQLHMERLCGHHLLRAA